MQNRPYNPYTPFIMSSKYDIFLSYARADEQFTSRLQAQLEHHGLRCWRDRDHISPIEYFFPEHLARAIEDSYVAIAILSDAYASSYYCLQEFVNCRVDQPLDNSKLRTLVIDPALENHPLIEASGNAPLRCNENIASAIEACVRQFRARSTRQQAFSVLANELLGELLSPSRSPNCRAYTELVLSPLIESELIGSALARKELGGTHRRVLALSEKLNRAKGAPEFLRQAVRSRTAYSHYILGNYDDALAIRLDDYKEGFKSRGAIDFSVMQDADMLVQCLCRSGRIDEAEILTKQNLALAKAHFGPDHEFSVGAMTTLAGIYADSGRYSEALPFAKAAYEAKQRILERPSAEWRSLVMNYGFLLMRTGAPKRALPLLVDVLQIYENDFGADNIDTAQAQIKVAECHLRLEEYELADSHSQSAMRAFSQLDVTHPLRAHGAVVAIQCAYANSNFNEQRRIVRTHVQPLIEEGGVLADQISMFAAENPEYFEAASPLELIDSTMDDWASLKKMGLRIVSTEESSTRACGVCVHVNAAKARCAIHSIDVNFESWSCQAFQFTGDSRIEGDVPDIAWRSLSLTANVALDGARTGDPDCQFIIGVLCAHRGLHQVVRDRLATEQGISPASAYAICSQELSASHWFSLAAMSDADASVGARLARRMLDADTPRGDIERNVVSFWKYSEDFLQKSEYFNTL